MTFCVCVRLICSLSVLSVSLQGATRLRPGKCFAQGWAKVSWPVSGSVLLLLLGRCPAGCGRTVCASGGAPEPGAKKAEGNPLRAGAGSGLSARNPVINVAMLDHAVSPVTGYDDMIEDQYADPVQQALELKR